MNAFSNQLDDPNTWRPITDQVMGGISKLVISHNDGVFSMKGEVSTENNGGFVRLSNRIDITNNDFKGIKFQAKGNNEFFGRDEFSNSVIVKSNQDITGRIKEVKIINGNQATLYGDIKNEVQKKEFAA